MLHSHPWTLPLFSLRLVHSANDSSQLTPPQLKSQTYRSPLPGPRPRCLSESFLKCDFQVAEASISRILAANLLLIAIGDTIMSTEKRNFSGLSFTSKKHSNDSNTHLPTKIKNFFRITSLGSGGGSSSSSSLHHDVPLTPKSESKSEARSTFRQSRFLPTIGRNRSTTVASEGNPLEEHMSPTAHANPYFAHQGPPTLRHHNEGSVPPSPPDTPKLQVNGVNGADEKAVSTGKEELARKLRRVASAPNAQGLFSSNKAENRPRTAELGKDPVVVEEAVSPKVSIVAQDDSDVLPLLQNGAKIPSPGQIRQSVAFRRTYSSNSIKVRNVEVGPGSFDKIKLIGKGDVGKVYLVREKKSNRLYAMKG